MTRYPRPGGRRFQKSDNSQEISRSWHCSVTAASILQTLKLPKRHSLIRLCVASSLASAKTSATGQCDQTAASSDMTFDQFLLNIFFPDNFFGA